MDAVFTKNTKGLFSDPPTSTPHYHPTTPRAQPENDEQATMMLGSVEHPDPSHILTPLRQPRPQTETQPSPTSRSHWDVKLCPSDTRRSGPGGAGDGSPASSKFDESWPSMSEDCRGQSTSGGQVGGEYHVKRSWRSDHLGITESASQDSTLGKFVERFRRAPPTSRASRDVPPNPFWWKSKSGEATPLEDPSTPASSNVSAESANIERSGPSPSHTHTDPSPGVSGEPSLDSRSQELIEKSLTVLSASESPPAQKYLNTLAAREARASNATTTERGTGTLHSRGSARVDFTADSVSDIGRVQAPPTGSSSGDILAQWRLRRRLEQARGEAVSRAHSLPLHEGGLQYGYHARNSAQSQLLQTTPLQCVTCGGDVLNRQQASTGQGGGARVSCGCGRGQGVAEKGGERVKILREQEIQTSPGLLANTQARTLQDTQEAGNYAHGHPSVRGSAQARAGLQGNCDDSDDHGSLNYPFHETTPTDDTPSRVEVEQEGGAAVPPLLVVQELSRREEISLTTPTACRESRGKVPPTHGGLALRDLDDTEFTMTLGTDLDNTSTCNEHHAPSMSTPTCHRCHDSDRGHNTEGTPPGLEPAVSQAAPTSKGCVTPPQREGELESGFPWDDDMGDELLKLLIAKAKLFEAQIRYVISRPLAAIEVEILEQLRNGKFDEFWSVVQSTMHAGPP